MPKRKPLTVRLSDEIESWLESEAKRTNRSKEALLETLIEESVRARKFPGIGFRGVEPARRAWMIGTALDVWELVELYEGKGVERLLTEHNVSRKQLELALAYRKAYPQEIDQALKENSRPPEEWHRLYPSVIPSL